MTEAYAKGYEDRSNEEVKNNTYDFDTNDWYEYEDGWQDAYEDWLISHE